MGKVIVNTTDATKTARNGSQETASHRETVRINGNMQKTDKSAKNLRALPAGKTVNQTAKSSDRTISKFRQLPAGDTKTQDHDAIQSKPKESNNSSIAVMKVSKDNGITFTEKPKNSNQNSSAKTAGRKIDPELALMASRSASVERGKISTTHKNGTSMSGMVREKKHVAAGAHVNPNGRISKVAAKGAEDKQTETELRFTKMKSTLIGVGVALIVAVVGFAGIALFGNNKKICVVNFESNGGSDVDGVEVVCGRTVSQPSDPVKDGFDFEGWIYDGDPFDFDTGIYRNATLVAKWSVKEGTDVVTVKFDTDGGSKINDIQLARGRTMSPPTAPKKIGYVLSDWYLGDKVFDFSTPITEDITLKAHWVRSTTPANPNNNTARPSNDRVTSINIGNLSMKVGETSSASIGIVPSTAVYELSVTSSNEAVVSCNVSDKLLNCTARQAGTATVNIKDSISGQSRIITVTVVAEEEPPVEDPNNPDGSTGDNNTGGDNQGGNTGDNNNLGDNTGGDNQGGDNTGDGNQGGDNTGGDNQGGNTGDNNNPGDNTGGDNQGGDNTGDGNQGGDNTGGDTN